MQPPRWLSDLSDLLPAERIATSEHDRRFYGADRCRAFAGCADLVLFPITTDEVARIIGRARERRIPLVPSGGRTGIIAGATATQGEVVLSLDRMRRIVAVDRHEQLLTAEAGVTLQAVQEAAREHGLFYPVDYASRGTTQLGGSIATNGGGTRVLRYGMTRDVVRGLTVVTGRGEVLHLGGRLVKNSVGADLKQLFIGTEGTLGIITEATVRLLLSPPPYLTALIGLIDATHVPELVTTLRGNNLTLALAEYFDRKSFEFVSSAFKAQEPLAQPYPHYLVVQIELPSSTTEASATEALESLLHTSWGVGDIVIASSSSQSDALLALREQIAEAINHLGKPHKNDIAVPPATVPTLLERLRSTVPLKPDEQLLLFGHLGDGNIHVNTVFPKSCSPDEVRERGERLDQVIYKIVLDLGGTLAAEHGVGLLKPQVLPLMRSGAELGALHALKAYFDPDGILNPGKLLP